MILHNKLVTQIHAQLSQPTLVHSWSLCISSNERETVL